MTTRPLCIHRRCLLKTVLPSQTPTSQPQNSSSCIRLMGSSIFRSFLWFGNFSTREGQEQWLGEQRMGTEAQRTAGSPNGLFFMDKTEPRGKGRTPSEHPPGRQRVAELQQGCTCAPRPLHVPTFVPQGRPDSVTTGCSSLPLLRDNCQETASS